MEIKKFCEYSEEEREELLMHWWHYYGKVMYTFAELEEFRKLVKENSMLMKDVALTSYLLGYSSQGLIKAMRTNDLDNYLVGIKAFTKSAEYKQVEDELEQIFLAEVVGTYNRPEPDVPMDKNSMIAQIVDLLGKNNAVDEIKPDKILTVDKVQEVYEKCLIRNDEVKDNMPTIDFVLGDGIHQASLFSSERLEKNKGEIISLIDELPDIDRGVSFLAFCEDKYGRQWTDLHSTMDLLVQLGRATGVIEFVLPRSDWDKFYGSVPEIIRNRENDDTIIKGNKPVEYKRVVDEFRKNNS